MLALLGERVNIRLYCAGLGILFMENWGVYIYLGRHRSIKIRG